MFKTNLLGITPLHGIAALLLFTLSGVLSATPGLPAEVAAARVRIENLTKVPGSDRGFPADDFFTFHRSDRVKNSNNQTVKYSESSKMRIHNDGDATLVITKLTTTNTSKFTISGVSIPSGGLKVAPGSYVDAVISFVATGLNAKTLHTETLVMQSNAANAGSVKATFRGAFMRSLEGSSEIDVLQVFESFGFGTQLGRNSDGSIQYRPSSNYPTDAEVNSGKLGDLIVSKYFVQADASKPLQMIQLAAFHSPGGAPSELRSTKSAVVGDMIYNHGALYHQTLLPHLTNTSSQIAGDFTRNIGEPFQIQIAGYRTTGGNYQNQLKDELLGIRVYRASDASGKVIPNEYIIVQDYIENGCGAGSANCDWNDNVSYIINARPLAVPTSTTIPNIVASAGVTKVYAVTDYFNRGYGGNKLTYSARLASGGNLPGWISLNAETGRFTFATPGNIGDQTIRISVTATDYNKLKTSSTFNVTIGGSAPPPPPSTPTPTPTPAPTPGANAYWLEAECAQVGSKWTKETSSSASGGNYVVVQRGSATGAPPADDATNRVRFVISSAKAGGYQLFARIDAPSGASDSYWVRLNNGPWYQWKSGMVQGGGFAWNQLPGAPLALKEGTNTIDFAFRESGTRLDKVYLTGSTTAPTGIGSPATNCGAVEDATSFWLEAECGSIGSGWTGDTDAGASNSGYVVFNGDRNISVPTSNVPAQQVTYQVNLTASGTYHLFLRADAPDPTRNSLWVRIDDGNWIKMWEEIGGAQWLTSGFQWRKVNQDGKDISFALSAGTHTIRVANRENGTKLDKLYLSPNSTVPTGFGSSATNCTSASSSLAAAAHPQSPSFSGVAEQAPRVDLFPNPAVSQLQVNLTSSYEGRVLVILTDLHGRRVRDLVFEKAGEQLRTEIDVVDLPAGVYHLRLLEGDRQMVKPFVKR